MTMRTEIEALDLLSQLGKEKVINYSAESKTVSAIVDDLLAYQLLSPAITKGTIATAYASLTRSVQADGDSILRVLLRLRDTVGGYLEVDNDLKLNWLESIGESKGQQIRYRKNLVGIEREIDYSALVNRLYAYGAGEGEARIALSAPGYIENTDSQTEWGGIYVGVGADRSITHPDTLLAWANLKLAELKNPPISYRVNSIDLSKQLETDFAFEALQLGSTVVVIDEDLGINVTVKVVRIEHPNLGEPQKMILELATRTKDITDTLTEVHDIQQLEQHVATEIGAGQVIVKGTFTVKDWVTSGETTIKGSVIQTGTIVLGKLDFIPLTSVGETGEVIATINASSEGIKISADKIEFVAGVNTFKQPGIPTSLVIGDIWFDTDDANKAYRAACVGADEIKAGEWELARDTQIVTNQSAIVINVDNILLRVSKNDVINQINISTEEIKIQAARIALEGVVVFTGGAAADVNAGETTISGGKITALSITADQLSAGEIITGSAQIKNGIIINAKIDTLEAGKITGEIVDGQIAGVAYAKITNVDIQTADIHNLAVTNAKVSAIDAGKITTGILVVARTQAKCTDPNADQTSTHPQSYYWISGAKPTIDADKTSANPQSYGWITGSKPPIDADHTADIVSDMAYEDLVQYAKLGSTIIQGGYIKSTLLTADNILVGTLSGNRIYGGTIAGTVISQAGGKVLINSSGLTIRGQFSIFKDSGGTTRGWVYGASGGLEIVSSSGELKLSGAYSVGLSPKVKIYNKLEQLNAYSNTLYDILPYDSNTWLGRSYNKFAKGYFTDLPSCPDGSPTVANALSIIKKIKPAKEGKGSYGKRLYFKDDDFPDEMKTDVIEKIITEAVQERRIVRKPTGEETLEVTEISPAKLELKPTGKKEIEYIRTIGVLVQAVKELDEKVEKLEAG